MINFATLQGLSIPEGKVVEIKDASGRVIWAVESDSDTVIVEVEKTTSNTYLGETEYKDEQFILLDIYPKTNGTVKVTYGGLTKTITDTSGVAEPNAQQVFFGTFGGVSDSVTTPASGILTIEGDYNGFAGGTYTSGDAKFSSPAYYLHFKQFIDLGKVTMIPNNAFNHALIAENTFMKTTTLKIPNATKRIGDLAFATMVNLTNVAISKGVTKIGANPWASINGRNNILSVAGGNISYKIDNNCLVEIATKKVISGFADSVIPSYIADIGNNAFRCQNTLQSIILPEGLSNIGYCAFYRCTGLTSVTIPASVKSIDKCAFAGCNSLTSVTFEDPTGWYVTQTEGATSGTTVDLSDSANNVELITSSDKYGLLHYWYHS